MRKIFFLLGILFPLTLSTQLITYDTIRVNPADERNIHRSQPYRTTQAPRQNGTQPQQRPTASNRTAASPIFDKRKLIYGANLGLSFSRNYTAINIGPQVGYQFNNYFMAGAGVKYYYSRQRVYFNPNVRIYKNNQLGTNIFGYFYPVRFLTLFAQPEINYMWFSSENETTGEKQTDNGAVPTLLVGAGLRLRRSHITLNYDLSQHANSPYPEGVFLGISVFF